MRFVVFAPSFPPSFRGGGPARTLEALTREAPSNFDVRVVTPDKDLGASEPMPVPSNEWSRFGDTPTFYASVDDARNLWAMYREVRKLRPDVIYLNSMFSTKFSVIPRLLAALGFFKPKAILLAPRGELDPGALAIRSTKKHSFIRFYKAFRLNRFVTWHASSPRERSAIIDTWGPDSTVIVRENETSLPREPIEGRPHVGPFKAVFISRISEKKGVLTAIRALRDVTSPVDFDVYGPEEDAAYFDECRSAARDLPVNCNVRFCGAVPHEDVRRTFNRYDAMFFPTAGENFGHVIAESLSASCPVILPDTTPWTALLNEGGGEIVQSNSVEEWSATINRVASMSTDERLDCRRDAGDAFTRWREKVAEPHVFALLEDHLRE
ncbi:glycosyltransferase family 4 protein [uncultured Corynebacterium sp.]|uniref:glycosyltransferase family 4 protein n=1 Tax=uncultured Corynebacterium sp. TaxID=159447 RepID=UPI0025F56DA9|nr:glycosyltransferase [uncultured Corynebacterium sp.]